MSQSPEERLLSVDPPLFQLSEVGSTQNWLKERHRQSWLPHGAAVFADIQTEGRGRPGNRWTHRPGNLAMSILLHSDPAGTTFPWTLVVAHVVLSILEQTVGSGFGIKYPNDLYWMEPEAKVGGILVESSGEGSYFVGVGLNRQDPELPGAGAMIRKGRPLPPDPIELPKRLQEALLSPEGFAGIEPGLSNHLLWKDQWVVWSLPEGPGMGKVQGLDERGHLKLLFPDDASGTLPVQVRGIRKIDP